MIQVKKLEVRPLSMVTKDGLQRIDLHYHVTAAAHLYLQVFRQGAAVTERVPLVMNSGTGSVSVFLPEQTESFEALWVLTDRNGVEAARTEALWKAPRHRTMYVMLSSHTDIGLHNSQYIQRYNTSRLLDMAAKLCDETADRDSCDQYRYTMEGTWFWNNYPMDRGEDAAREMMENYVKTGKIGLCCGIAGNHFQTFGQEELCRSAYERKKLMDKWGLDSRTLAVIDINGIPMSIIQPYTEAGVENLIFAPNHWNPKPSTIWKMDMAKDGCYLNPDAGGGGSRADVRYESELPMVFFWENPNGEKLLVWASTQYGYGGASIGLFPNRKFVPETVPTMEIRMGEHLPLLDEKYPYDVWLLCCYDDDSDPDMEVTNSIRAWNEKWAWPRLRTLGAPDEPFRLLRQKHGQEIPVLRGDITGGWYQHPLTAAELLARKFGADRLLPTAEKWSAVAAMVDETYDYPAEDFDRTWYHLLLNDEHSYGVSGYQGRRVYETWMQHRDWIEKAEATAQGETAAALHAIAAKIPVREDSVAVFNPTGIGRRELVETDAGSCVAEIPAFGYRVIGQDQFTSEVPSVEKTTQPPVIENAFYRVAFGENGSLCSVYDKDQGRELLDMANPFRANELVYTRDNHQTFLVPEKAEFEIRRETGKVTVLITTRLEQLGAEIQQTVTLPEHEKRIDFDNRIFHAKDMVNRNRYNRYLYFAFPFQVENCRRYCHLNGVVTEYGADVTGHGTDVYMAANEWCCAENEQRGVALLLPDSQLMEFDHIHPDKTDFGDAGAGSAMFAYVATDWLQMHLPGGSHLNYRFRFAITSYDGSFEQAGIPQLAELYLNPVQPVTITKQEGTLDPQAHSFLKIPEGQRLIALKRAQDGNGIIVRLQGRGAGMENASRVSIDETPLTGSASETGFSTWRLGSGILKLKERPVVQTVGENGAPAPIGSVYTGLITEPCAAAGEHDGHLYLLWGASMEEDFSHYHLYRSEEPGFIPDESTFLARVEPEVYRTGRYVDMGLKHHTCYYYRVCAVNREGIAGPMSREFAAFTREGF